MSSSRVVNSSIAVVVGAIIAVGVVMVTTGPVERPTESAAAVQRALVDRWEVWRRATASFTEESTRRSNSRELVTTVRIAQRFPDRVVHDGTDVSARVGGRLIGCTEQVGARARCTDTGGYRPDDELAIEIEALRAATNGPGAPYRVSRLGRDCFRLRHVGTEARKRYGDRLDICFDAATGVAVSELTQTGELRVSVRRTDIDGVVGDAKLALPATPSPATPR